MGALQKSKLSILGLLLGIGLGLFLRSFRVLDAPKDCDGGVDRNGNKSEYLRHPVIKFPNYYLKTICACVSRMSIRVSCVLL